MKKDNLYALYQKQIKDKDTSVNSLIENTLAKTQSMFAYNELSDIKSRNLERILQTKGHCIITDIDGKLYALSGAFGGDLDAYEQPTKYTICNPFLKLNKTFDLQTDNVVLCQNDTNSNSLLPIIGKFSVLLTDSLLSLNIATILNRATYIISAADDQTRESAEKFIEKILDGDFSVIGENAFFKGVNLQNITNNTNYLTQLIEVIQYFKASMLNELGLNANFNMKRERLNLQEVTANEDMLFPYVDNMLQCRQDFIKEVNEKFNKKISVELNSSWNVNHENLEKIVQNIDTEGAEQPTKDDKTTE